MSAQLERLAARLHPEPAEAERFVAAINAGRSGRPVAIWPVSAPGRSGLPEWLPDCVGITAPDKPQVYQLDLSSAWELAPVTILPRQPQRLLDLCAAPGGKSVLAARELRPPFHLANEMVPKRLGILRHTAPYRRHNKDQLDF